MSLDNIIKMLVAKLTPAMLLRDILEEAGDIEAIACVVVYKDETMSVEYSNTSMAKLCMMARVFDQEVDDAVREGE